MIWFIGYMIGAVVVGGITYVVVSQDHYNDEFDNALISIVAALVWPLVAFGGVLYVGIKLIAVKFGEAIRAVQHIIKEK